MKGWVVLAAVIASAIAACGSGEGACVSDPVDVGSIGLRVYCYENWDEADCDKNKSNKVNGASWTFYDGKTCKDRGYSTGSNKYP